MKQYLYRSIGLHLAVFLILVIDLPMFGQKKMTIGQAPIIVDLQDVKLSEMTNLPPKAVFGEEDKKATAPEKQQPNWTKEEKKAEPEPEEKEEKVEPKKDFVDVSPQKNEEKKEEPKPEPKPTPKPEPKKPVPTPSKKPKPKPENKPKPQEKSKPEPKKTEVKTVTNPLKSLMDTVNSMEKDLAKEASPAVIKEGTVVQNMGIEGGTGGSYFSELSITETDAIAGRLRECWNLDPGARGIENMIIEIRAYLNRDGTIRDVKILDTSRYNSDPHFRAIAESARRAVISCQNHNNVNIYQIFATKYADKYSLWNTLLLKFNPMDASIQ